MHRLEAYSQIAADVLGTPEKLGRVKRKPHHAPIYGCPYAFNQLKLWRLIRPLDSSGAVLNFSPRSEEPPSGDSRGGERAVERTTPPAAITGFRTLKWNNENDCRVPGCIIKFVRCTLAGINGHGDNICRSKILFVAPGFVPVRPGRPNLGGHGAFI
jgi:hypothetical protein